MGGIAALILPATNKFITRVRMGSQDHQRKMFSKHKTMFLADSEDGEPNGKPCVKDLMNHVKLSLPERAKDLQDNRHAVASWNDTIADYEEAITEKNKKIDAAAAERSELLAKAEKLDETILFETEVSSLLPRMRSDPLNPLCLSPSSCLFPGERPLG